MANRAIAFIDGNNWYHCCKREGIDANDYDIIKVASKLSAACDLIGIRYYIGLVPQTGNLRLHADQQRYLSRIKNQDARVSVHDGRIEPRFKGNEAAAELLEYLANLRTQIDRQVFRELVELGKRHKVDHYMVEKGVDVRLAVDLVTLADRNEYDTAYVLSADGDYTYAAEFVRSLGKRIFAVSPGYGAQLAAVVNKFIHVKREWLESCRG